MGGPLAYWLNLGVVVKRDLVFVVDVIELLLCDLDSCARHKEHLPSAVLITIHPKTAHLALF
jgi:hypothetical protein